MRSGAFAFGGAVIASLCGLLLTIVVTRGLGVTGAGVFFVSIGIFSIASNTLELGADTSLVRQLPRLCTVGRSADVPRTIVIATVPVFVVAAIAAAAIAIWSPTLARVFMEQGSTALGADFLRAVAPWLAFAPLATVLIAGTRGLGGVRPYVLIQSISMPVLRLAAIAFLVVAGLATDRSVATAWGVPWALAAGAALVVVVSLTGRLRREDASAALPARPWSQIGREFWSFASARAFAGTAEVTLVWLDVLLVGWLVGPRQAGIYGAASRFITAGTLVMQASRVSIAPRLSRLLSAGRSEEATRLYHGATEVTVLASWPLYLGLAGFAPAILRLFGHGFGPGATALTILALAMLVDTYTGNIQTVLLMSGLSQWNLFNAVLALVIDVGLDLLLIPSHGATGAAIGWAAAIVTMNVAACLQVRYVLHLRVFNRSTTIAAVAAIVCFGLPMVLVIPILGRGVAGLAVWVPVGVLLMAIWLWQARDRMGLGEALAAVVPVNIRPKSAGAERG
jgi:O-antigen/teichoic acid export membrane protein